MKRGSKQTSTGTLAGARRAQEFTANGTNIDMGNRYQRRRAVKGNFVIVGKRPAKKATS